MRAELKLFVDDGAPIVFMKSADVSYLGALQLFRMMRAYHQECDYPDNAFDAIELEIRSLL